MAKPELIACPICDLLQTSPALTEGARASCPRCGTLLLTNRARAFDRALATSFASVILMTSAIFFPFLEMTIAGLHSRASVMQVALAFSGTLVAPLSVLISLMIVVVPLLRAAALTYTILPLRMGRRPAPGAEQALRLSSELRPWSMAEVFMVGVVVAMVKMAGMASVSLGPAFWALAALVVVVIYETASLSEWSIWQALEAARR